TVVAHLYEGLAGFEAFLATVVSSIVFLCFYSPLEKRVQTTIDARFFRQYADREEKLYELSREVVTHTTADAMGEALMRVIMEALHPKTGTLFLKSRDSAGFVRVSGGDSDLLPKQMQDDSALVAYFKDHPLPFVQESNSSLGASYSTRTNDARDDA